MTGSVKRVIALASIIAAMALAPPALGAVHGFAIVNKAGGALSGVALRRVGSSEWTPLAVAASPGATVRAAFTNPDCAFDLRATVVGAGQVIWGGVNLCDVKSVTLNRDPAGRSWVDYD